MMKLGVKPLVSAFTGLRDRFALDVADSMGNRSATPHSIAQVLQALARMGHQFQSRKGYRELAQNDLPRREPK